MKALVAKIAACLDIIKECFESPLCVRLGARYRPVCGRPGPGSTPRWCGVSGGGRGGRFLRSVLLSAGDLEVGRKHFAGGLAHDGEHKIRGVYRRPDASPKVSPKPELLQTDGRQTEQFGKALAEQQRRRLLIPDCGAKVR